MQNRIRLIEVAKTEGALRAPSVFLCYNIKMKNFDDWNILKKNINEREINPDLFFHEREVWWCSLGINIGSEADGKNEIFERPVLIIKKFNSEMVWAVSLTSKEKVGKHYLKVKHNKGESYVNLSQLKTVSTKRFQRKIGMINEEDFLKVIDQITNYLKTSKPAFAGFSEAEATNKNIIANQKKKSRK